MPHTPMTFSRYGMWLGETLAYRRFRAHHTEINNLYWSLAPVAGYGDYLARRTQETSPAVLFHASGPDVRRLAPSVEHWRAYFKDFQNWVRLAALMSASAYFEMFLIELLTLAMRSDPLSRFGSPRLLDGVTWLKQGVGGVPDVEIRACLVGEWSKRRKAMRGLLGKVPADIEANLAELDRIRKLRNKVGHAFGRTFEQKSRLLQVNAPNSERLSERRFKGWLGLIDTIANGVDQEIGGSHVGEFETLLYYHEWRREPRFGKQADKPEAVRFAKALNSKFGGGPDRTFCRDLIAHYVAC
jgi:hypothetical protein